MDKKPLIVVSICAVVLLVLGSLSNVVGYQTIQSRHQQIVNESIKQSNPPLVFDSRGLNITLNGTMGENGWFVSNVKVSFTCNFSYEVLYYKVNNGSWNIYSAPLIVTTDGYFTISAYCVFSNGNQSNIALVSFKIDQTHPILIECKQEHVGLFLWKLSANAFDETSGINRVDFGFVQFFKHFIDTEPPYQATYRGFWWINYIISSFINAEPPIEVWDNAGNSLIHPT